MDTATVSEVRHGRHVGGAAADAKKYGNSSSGAHTLSGTKNEQKYVKLIKIKSGFYSKNDQNGKTKAVVWNAI